jgi:cell filamentation protein
VAGDPYVYPGTEVLRNKLAIRDAATLEQVEGELARLAAYELAANPIPGDYDLAHLRRMHARLFADVYDWAGELRTVTIAKADLFALPQHIESYAGEVLGQLAREQHLTGLPREKFVGRLAHYLGEVNAIHPFREGNGRAQRAFFSQLVGRTGHRLMWDRVTPGENLAASVRAMRGDEGPLRELLDRALETG